jgi:hypothetical protein
MAATETHVTPDDETTSWTDLGKEMWTYLTGRDAAIDYQFIDMDIDVPRETGPDAPTARWRIDGTLRITTAER